MGRFTSPLDTRGHRATLSVAPRHNPEPMRLNARCHRRRHSPSGWWRMRGELRPLVRDHSPGGVGVPWQLPAIGTLVVVEFARHADDRRFVRADVLPTVINPGRDDDESLVPLPQHELVGAAEGGRLAPAVIADDA